MNKYAFLVGVGEYDSPAISAVPFAARDAETIGGILRDRCGFETRILTNPGAGEFARSLGNLLSVIEDPDSLFCFFFAGHGVEYDNESCLLLRDAFPEDRLGMYQLSALRDRFARLRCRNRLVFLDCCRNDPRASRGKAANNLMGGRLSAALNGLGGRDIASTAADPDAGRLTLLLKACAEGERAYEWEARQHGAFSWFLKEGLEGAAWRDDSLSAHDLCAYVSGRVRDWAGEQGLRQSPDFRQDGAAGDIMLAGPDATERERRRRVETEEEEARRRRELEEHARRAATEAAERVYRKMAEREQRVVEAAREARKQAEAARAALEREARARREAEAAALAARRRVEELARARQAEEASGPRADEWMEAEAAPEPIPEPIPEPMPEPMPEPTFADTPPTALVSPPAATRQPERTDADNRTGRRAVSLWNVVRGLLDVFSPVVFVVSLCVLVGGELYNWGQRWIWIGVALAALAVGYVSFFGLPAKVRMPAKVRRGLSVGSGLFVKAARLLLLGASPVVVGSALYRAFTEHRPWSAEWWTRISVALAASAVGWAVFAADRKKNADRQKK